MNRLREIIVLFGRKSRWNEYKSILEKAIQKGYIVTSVIDWFKNYRGYYKVLILRHDVDMDIESAARMHQIEKSLGVHSSFYFRWSTANPHLIAEIRNYGSEVGLHYETLGNYALEHGIRLKEEITEEVFNDCREILKGEIRKFKELFGEIEIVVSHSAIGNRIIGMPNYKMTEGENAKDYGILLFAYDSNIRKEFDIYIADASVYESYWKYGVSVIEALDQEKRTICFLSHPHNWHYSFTRNLSSAIKTIIRDVMDLNYKKIADSRIWAKLKMMEESMIYNKYKNRGEPK